MGACLAVGMDDNITSFVIDDWSGEYEGREEGEQGEGRAAEREMHYEW